MSKPQSFIHGTLTLVMTGLLVRLLGFIIRLIMVRAVGESAIGLYHLVLPTFFFVFTFTQLGLPVAISQRVSKYYSKHDTKTIRRLFYRFRARRHLPQTFVRMLGGGSSMYD